MHKINSKLTEWNLKDLLESDDDPKVSQLQNQLVKANEEFVKKWENRDDYLKDPKILKQALDEYEELDSSFGDTGAVFYYYWLRSHQDQENTEIKAKYNKAEELSIKLANDIQFFTYRIAKIPESEQEKFLQAPELADYKHFLELEFRSAKYLLSEPEEKILNLTSTFAHSNWVKMVSDFVSREEKEVLDEEGNVKKLNFTEILKQMKSQNKAARDSAATAFNEILAKHLDVAEAELNSIMGHKKVTDDLRGLKRPDEGRHLSEDIETEVVDALIDAVSSRYDIPARYYELKARLLGQNKLAYHERNVEYRKISKNYLYEESVDLIGEVFKKLDTEFYVIFKKLVEEGRVDVFPKKGKANGAFCVHILKSQPTFVLLNHTNKLDDVTTLAHEMGHAINNELMKKTQNSLNFDTSLSTAEVASTFMEDFALEKIVEDADDELKLSINVMRMDEAVSSISRQIACYRFEQDLHNAYREKGYLSKKEIGELFTKNMAGYMGEFVEQSPGSENWWVYWSHIRSFFYVYSYASGLLISKALQNMVRQNPAEITKVKEFLSAGTSDSPKNIFLKMGVDISDKNFWLKGLGEVEELLNETIALADKLGK